MAMTMDLGRLTEAVAKDAAIRRVQRLQPAGGPGDKVFPPTYPGEGGPVHVFETRRVDGQDVRCVLLDSVQSQANRLEEVLRDAIRAERMYFPHLLVDFTGKKAKVGEREYDLSDIGQVTVLDAPHRVFDAIIRDSELDGTPFPASDAGERLRWAKPHDARALFELSPTALLFGAWNSHGEGGGLGAKFTRCLVSDIIGVGAQDGMRGAIRIDPLGIRKDVEVIGGRMDWRLAEAGEKGRVRPSEIGHSNVPASRSREDRRNVWEGGVTIDYALHTAVITCAGLRRLRFPGTTDENAGRTVLAALGLVALTLQDEAGYALRSRCDLVCDGTAPFQVVHPNGATDEFEIDAKGAVAIFSEAVETARKAGFQWGKQPIRLVPQKRLVELVALSRAKGLAGETEDEGA